MTINMEKRIEQLHSLVSAVQIGTEGALKQMDELELNNERKLEELKLSTDRRLKELTTALSNVQDELKFLQWEKKQREKQDVERDRRAEEMIRENNTLRAKVDFLQSQMTSLLVSLKSPPEATVLQNLFPESNRSPSEESVTLRNKQSIHASESDTNVQEKECKGDSYDSCLLEHNKSDTENEHQAFTTDITSSWQPRAIEFKPNFSVQPNSQKNVQSKTQPILSARETSSFNVPANSPTSSMTAGSSLAEPEVKAIVRVENKEYYGSHSVWIVEADAEIEAASKTAVGTIEGAQTILLIDTSASMAENGAWGQATAFVNAYLNGLMTVEAKYGLKVEYVSIVTFGSQTRCQQRFTNDYNLLKTVFSSLKIGGPSPLFGGLHMAAAVAVTVKKRGLRLLNGIIVSQKIILLTDGFPTELRLFRGPDKPDTEQMDQTTGTLLTVADMLLDMEIDVFCVPVGNSNMEFLRTFLSKEYGRRILHFSDGQYFARRLLLTMKLKPTLTLLGLGGGYTTPVRDPDIGARDEVHLQDILDDVRIKLRKEHQQKLMFPYSENPKNSRLLPVGSRVRRGPDWDLDDHDGNGPGTVVGHHLYLDMLWIHWDKTREVRQYYFGHNNQYFVFPVDEPRVPLPGQPLDVGCVVQTGKDWKDDDVPLDTKGVVIQMTNPEQGTSKAVVRWENGKRGKYSYGTDRVFEIQICLPSAEQTSDERSLNDCPGSLEQRSSTLMSDEPLKALTDSPRANKLDFPQSIIPAKVKNKNQNV